MQPERAKLPPVFAGILVGGGSTRMGSPKHLLRAGERTFLETVLTAVEPHVERVVILGAGELPERCRQLKRLPDVSDLAGPLAGILAAMRWNSDVAWLIAACDMPLITSDAVAWLLAQRSPDHIAILPRSGGGRPEPLLAVYEPAALPALETLAASKTRAPHRMAEHDGVFTPTPSTDLASAWRNVNRPDDLDNLS